MQNCNLVFYNDKLKFVLELLRKGSPRIVGGSVRDKMSNVQSSDIDIASSLSPTEVTTILEKNNVKVALTGIKYGTVTAIFENQKFEITTLRRDLECDGRYATKVEFTDNFYEDAARRDFTINALSYSTFENKLYDYFDGVYHLKNKQVIFIGDPNLRIKEDYLRILRFFRFSVYYAHYLDPFGLEACVRHKENLVLLSKERITKEFNKLLEASHTAWILKELKKNHVLESILPNISVDLLELVEKRAEKEKIKVSITTKYSLLLYNRQTNLKTEFILYKRYVRQINYMINFINQLVLSNQSVVDSVMYHWVSSEIDSNQYLIVSYALDKLSFDEFKNLRLLFATDKPKMPVNGMDLQDLGYQCQDIAFNLDILKKKWISSNFKMTNKELIRCLTQEY